MNKDAASSQTAVSRFETIWNHVECGIVVIDLETQVILDANPRAASMYGGSREDIVGKVCKQIFCPSDTCPMTEHKLETNHSERQFIKATGEIMPITKSAVKIDYDGRPAFLECFFDLSHIKETEEKIHLLQVAEHVRQAKTEFLSRLSHEMRTPMNAILGMVQIAKNSDDADELKYCVDKLSDSGSRLFELINDFLDMSEIEAGKFALEHISINIEKMLVNVCNLMIDRIEAKNIKLGIALGRDMRMNYLGDERRLSQVITCLLSNAVKYTSDGGNIEIAVEEAQIKERSSVLRFSVKDTGIGMTDEQLDRIWKSYEQAENDTFNKYGGMGIGLSIVKNIVEKMEGGIWVDSEPGKGSEFHFEVEMRRPEHQDGAIIFGDIHPSDIKVLIIDGDKEASGHFKSIIDSFGMNVDDAETVERAVSLVKLAKAAGNPYDMIFSDYGSSNTDGIAAAKKIYPLIDKNTVIVIVTQSLKWKRIERYANSIGIDRYLSKPLFPSVILDMINDIISSTVKHFDIQSDHTKQLPDFSDLTLLYAEDNQISRNILLAQLADTHISVDCADNGKAAAQLFLENPDRYDLIFTDINMPVMDGYELARTIRSFAFEKAKSIPIIATTANTSQKDINLCLASGMDDHLAKPFVLNIVIEKIDRYKNRKTSVSADENGGTV